MTGKSGDVGYRAEHALVVDVLLAVLEARHHGPEDGDAALVASIRQLESQFPEPVTTADGSKVALHTSDLHAELADGGRWWFESKATKQPSRMPRTPRFFAEDLSLMWRGFLHRRGAGAERDSDRYLFVVDDRSCEHEDWSAWIALEDHRLDALQIPREDRVQLLELGGDEEALASFEQRLRRWRLRTETMMRRAAKELAIDSDDRLAKLRGFAGRLPVTIDAFERSLRDSGLLPHASSTARTAVRSLRELSERARSGAPDPIGGPGGIRIARDHLLDSIQGSARSVLLTAEAGSGKTYLLHRLVEQMSAGEAILLDAGAFDEPMLRSGKPSPSEILRAFLGDGGRLLAIDALDELDEKGRRAAQRWIDAALKTHGLKLVLASRVGADRLLRIMPGELLEVTVPQLEDHELDTALAHVTGLDFLRDPSYAALRRLARNPQRLDLLIRSRARGLDAGTIRTTSQLLAEHWGLLLDDEAAHFARRLAAHASTKGLDSIPVDTVNPRPPSAAVRALVAAGILAGTKSQTRLRFRSRLLRDFALARAFGSGAMQSSLRDWILAAPFEPERLSVLRLAIGDRGRDDSADLLDEFRALLADDEVVRPLRVEIADALATELDGPAVIRVASWLHDLPGATRSETWTWFLRARARRIREFGVLEAEREVWKEALRHPSAMAPDALAEYGAAIVHATATERRGALHDLAGPTWDACRASRSAVHGVPMMAEALIGSPCELRVWLAEAVATPWTANRLIDLLPQVADVHPNDAVEAWRELRAHADEAAEHTYDVRGIAACAKELLERTPEAMTKALHDRLKLASDAAAGADGAGLVRESRTDRDVLTPSSHDAAKALRSIWIEWSNHRGKAAALRSSIEAFLANEREPSRLEIVLEAAIDALNERAPNDAPLVEAAERILSDRRLVATELAGLAGNLLWLMRERTEHHDRAERLLRRLEQERQEALDRETRTLLEYTVTRARRAAPPWSAFVSGFGEPPPRNEVWKAVLAHAGLESAARDGSLCALLEGVDRIDPRARPDETEAASRALEERWRAEAVSGNRRLAAFLLRQLAGCACIVAESGSPSAELNGWARSILLAAAHASDPELTEPTDRDLAKRPNSTATRARAAAGLLAFARRRPLSSSELAAVESLSRDPVPEVRNATCARIAALEVHHRDAFQTIVAERAERESGDIGAAIVDWMLHACWPAPCADPERAAGLLRTLWARRFAFSSTNAPERLEKRLLALALDLEACHPNLDTVRDAATAIVEEAATANLAAAAEVVFMPLARIEAPAAADVLLARGRALLERTTPAKAMNSVLRHASLAARAAPLDGIRRALLESIRSALDRVPVRGLETIRRLRAAAAALPPNEALRLLDALLDSADREGGAIHAGDLTEWLADGLARTLGELVERDPRAETRRAVLRMLARLRHLDAPTVHALFAALRDAEA